MVLKSHSTESHYRHRRGRPNPFTNDFSEWRALDALRARRDVERVIEAVNRGDVIDRGAPCERQEAVS